MVKYIGEMWGWGFKLWIRPEDVLFLEKVHLTPPPPAALSYYPPVRRKELQNSGIFSTFAGILSPQKCDAPHAQLNRKTTHQNYEACSQRKVTCVEIDASSVDLALW